MDEHLLLSQPGVPIGRDHGGRASTGTGTTGTGRGAAGPCKRGAGRGDGAKLVKATTISFARKMGDQQYSLNTVYTGETMPQNLSILAITCADWEDCGRVMKADSTLAALMMLNELWRLLVEVEWDAEVLHTMSYLCLFYYYQIFQLCLQFAWSHPSTLVYCDCMYCKDYKPSQTRHL